MHFMTSFWGGLWIFLIVVVALETIQKMMRYKYVAQQSAKRQTGADDEVLKRLEKIEQRVANLETIVLDREKKNNWEKLF